MILVKIRIRAATLIDFSENLDQGGDLIDFSENSDQGGDPNRF